MDFLKLILTLKKREIGHDLSVMGRFSFILIVGFLCVHIIRSYMHSFK